MARFRWFHSDSINMSPKFNINAVGVRRDCANSLRWSFYMDPDGWWLISMPHSLCAVKINPTFRFHRFEQYAECFYFILLIRNFEILFDLIFPLL